MRSGYLTYMTERAFARLYVESAGARDAHETLICVHGLLRSCADFRALALTFSDRWQVLCPDLPGQGRSEWLEDKLEYGTAPFRAVSGLISRHADDSAINFLGTSAGAQVGIWLAAKENSPIRRLIINDVAPAVTQEMLQRLVQYVRWQPSMADQQAAIDHLQAASGGCSYLDENAWKARAEGCFMRRDDGTWGIRHDPGIADSFSTVVPESTMWERWGAIRCPVLVIRGEKSAVLTAESAARMRDTGRQVDLVEVAGVGHAPALSSQAELKVIRHWLEGGSVHGTVVRPEVVARQLVNS